MATKTKPRRWQPSGAERLALNGTKGTTVTPFPLRLPRHRVGLYSIGERIDAWRRTGRDPYLLWLESGAWAAEGGGA